MPDFGFDEWMDAQLRNVPVPRDLQARIAADARATAKAEAQRAKALTDDRLDALLRDVALPAQLERRLRRIPWQQRSPHVWRRMAMAASVLIVIGGGYFILYSGGSPDAASVANTSVPQANPPAQAPQLAEQPLKALAERKISTRPSGRSATRPPQASEIAKTSRSQPVADSSAQPPAEAPSLFDGVASVSTTIKKAVDAKLRSNATLGAAGQIERLPELEVFEAPPARGIAPPRVRGYDMLFQLKYGEHPFVSPAAHKDLRVSRLPFSFRTASYDQAVESVQSGRLPAGGEIRVEDFLAAQRYPLPAAPAGTVALNVAASPTPSAEPGLHLLHLALNGGPLRNDRHKPAGLVVVLEASSHTRATPRWAAIERGLASLQRSMSPDDRVTLVTFAAQPRVLLTGGSRNDLQKILNGQIEQLEGTPDVLAASQVALQSVRAFQARQGRRVVFLTGRAKIDPSLVNEFGRELAALDREKISWHAIRVSTPGDEAWDELAEQSHGGTSIVDSAHALENVMREQLIGRSAVVAQGVSLKLTFNPQVVTSYRLFGHESATLTGEANDPLEIDLAADQAATGLYELWLKPTGGDDLATVELVWREPSSGQPRRSTRTIKRGQISQSFSQAPAWLQQAFIAARAAEVLRGSYYVPNGRQLDRVLELAADVHPQAAERPEFQALLELIKQASKLR